MATKPQPCDQCPRILSNDPRNAAALTPEVKASAAAGAWFCCHKSMGTCHGAAAYAESQARREERANA